MEHSRRQCLVSHLQPPRNGGPPDPSQPQQHRYGEQAYSQDEELPELRLGRIAGQLFDIHAEDARGKGQWEEDECDDGHASNTGCHSVRGAGFLHRGSRVLQLGDIEDRAFWLERN
jgi:hypothetical protein